MSFDFVLVKRAEDLESCMNTKDTIIPVRVSA
jgi:hypothetical protein